MSEQKKPESPAEMGKRVIAEKKQQDKEKLIAELTLSDRLMRMTTTTDIVEVPVKDDLGEFKIRCRRYTWAENEESNSILLDILKNKNQTDPETVRSLTRDLNKRLFKLLAYPDGVCLDPQLNVAFWEKGNFPDELPAQITRVVSRRSKAALDAASSFRKDESGPANS